MHLKGFCKPCILQLSLSAGVNKTKTWKEKLMGKRCQWWINREKLVAMVFPPLHSQNSIGKRFKSGRQYFEVRFCHFFQIWWAEAYLFPCQRVFFQEAAYKDPIVPPLLSNKQSKFSLFAAAFKYKFYFQQLKFQVYLKKSYSTARQYWAIDMKNPDLR